MVHCYSVNGSLRQYVGACSAGSWVPRPGIDSRPCLANARVYINADVDLKRETVLKDPVRFFDLPHQLAFNRVIVRKAGSPE
ncbi:hypothetical protein ATY38_05295 [Nitrosomonas ureae]|nr:hypothetical protein ATY38_05295 [Nitrosomonas ureae]